MRPVVHVQPVQVRNPPSSGKDTAEGKGVHRKVKSEEAGCWNRTNGQISGLTNRNHIRLCKRIWHDKLKSNYTESCMVYVADGWRERMCEYQGYRQLMIITSWF